jgi:hypothetical protein
LSLNLSPGYGNQPEVEVELSGPCCSPGFGVSLTPCPATASPPRVNAALHPYPRRPGPGANPGTDPGAWSRGSLPLVWRRTFFLMAAARPGSLHPTGPRPIPDWVTRPATRPSAPAALLPVPWLSPYCPAALVACPASTQRRRSPAPSGNREKLAKGLIVATELSVDSTFDSLSGFMNYISLGLKSICF